MKDKSMMTAKVILSNHALLAKQRNYWSEYDLNYDERVNDEIDDKALVQLERTIESVRGRLDPAYNNHYHRGFDIAIDAVKQALGLGGHQ